MAATPTLLTSGTSAANPATTASVSPTDNRLLELDIWVAKSGAPVPAEGDIGISWLGLTWTLVASQDYRARRRLWRFRALDGAPGSGTGELTYSGGGTFQEMSWALVEWAGVDTTGTNGSGAVGTPATGDVGTGSTSLSLTIADTPAAGDAVSAAWGVEEGGGTASLEVGYTELAAVESGVANIRQAVVGWEDAADDTTPSVSWSSSSTGAGGITNLVIAGTGGQAVTPAPVTITATPGTMSLALSVGPASPTVTATPGTLALAVDIPLDAAAVTVAPGTVTITQGGTVLPEPVTVTAAPATLTVSTGATEVAPGPVNVAANPGTLSLDLTVAPAAAAVTATPGVLTVAAGAAAITLTAVAVTVAAGVVAVQAGGTPGTLAATAPLATLTATAPGSTLTTTAPTSDLDATGGT